MLRNKMSTARAEYVKAQQCDGKIKYTTRKAAKKALYRWKRAEGNDEKRNFHRLTVYQCPFCYSWHMGNNREGWEEE